MSYCFQIRAANKAEAKDKVNAELQKVVELQPIHAVDLAQAQAAAHAFIDLLPDDDNRDVSVRVNGSVSWSGPESQPFVVGTGVGVSAAFVLRE